MNKFHVETRRRTLSSIYFPALVKKERDNWGQTNVTTDGVVHSYRPIHAQPQQVRQLETRIANIAARYSAARKDFKDTDRRLLEEEMPGFRPAGFEYFDYQGRMETVSRERIGVLYANGSRINLGRDVGVGFRGIITRTAEGWSTMAFAAQELQRRIISYLNRGEDTQAAVDAGVQSASAPWELRRAVERHLSRILNVAWAEYTTDSTPEKLQAVIQIEEQLHDYVGQSLRWWSLVHNWEFAEPIPFPTPEHAIRLWEQDRIDTIEWERLYPWWFDVPKITEKTITMIRRAYLYGQKSLITITTNPRITGFEHPDLPVAHHQMWYGPCSPIHPTVERPEFDNAGQPVQPQRGVMPFAGLGGSNAYDGNIQIATGWRVLQGGTPGKEGSPLPEPTLRVRSRPIFMDDIRTMEMIQALLEIKDQPTLFIPPRAWNNAVAPVLILPDTYMQTSIVPLYEGSRILEPVQDFAKVSGWVTASAQGQDNFFDDATPPGFLSRHGDGVATRLGAAQELLPY